MPPSAGPTEWAKAEDGVVDLHRGVVADRRLGHRCKGILRTACLLNTARHDGMGRAAVEVGPVRKHRALFISDLQTVKTG